jgi:hypothetical protein
MRSEAAGVGRRTDPACRAGVDNPLAPSHLAACPWIQRPEFQRAGTPRSSNHRAATNLRPLM